MTPAFAAAIASWLGKPMRAAAVVIRMITPPFFRRTLWPPRTVANAEVRLVAIVSFHYAGDVVWAGFKRIDPTQFRIPWIWPIEAVA